MKKRILHVLKSNKFSGAENVVCQIINLFNEDEEMLYVSPDGPIADKLKEKYIKYVPIKKLSVSEIKRVIKEYKPDIIHAHDMSATVICSLFASKNIKVISHIHGTFKTLSSKNIKSFIFYKAAKRCEKIIFVSNETYNSFIFKDRLKNKCILLRNIINPIEMISKVNADRNEYDNDVIFLGRLVEVKNPERFIDVVELIKKKISDVKVAIVGDGDLKEKIENLIKEKNLCDNVKMYGFMSNPYKLLSQSKILVMTSISEGTPMVSLEAMANGLAIVSTPVDGLKELVIKDKNGFLSDSNEELSNYIVKILKDEDLRKEMIKFTKNFFYEINDIEKYKMCLKEIYTKKSMFYKKKKGE